MFEVAYMDIIDKGFDLNVQTNAIFRNSSKIHCHERM